MSGAAHDQVPRGHGPQIPGNRLGSLLVAAGLVVVSVAVRLAFAPAFGSSGPYLQFFPAVLVASWLGLAPGLLATALSTVAAAYYFLPPNGLAVEDVHDHASLALFGLVGLFIAWLGHRRLTAESAQRAAVTVSGARAERLDAIINTTVDGIILIDSKGLIEAFNRGAERLFGYSESDVLGRNISMLMPSPNREEHDRYLERYLTTGHARIIGIGRDVTGQRRDGSTFPLRLAVSEASIGGRRRFTGVLHDLTDRVQLEGQLRSSEARWRAVIDSAVDGIIVIDSHGRIESFNTGAVRMFGYELDEVLGQNVAMLMPSPYRDEHDGYLSRYLTTGHAKIIGIGREVAGRRKDGTTFPLQLSVGQITIGGEPKFTGILHDISTRVRMEEQLREQTSLARLGEMAAVIAHEVKNPLAGIRGAIQVIGSRLSHASDAAVTKEIIARIDSLDQLMKEMLLFARPPQPRRAPTDVAALLISTASFLRQDPAFRDVEVAVDGAAPPVHADAEMLKIVFQNLLINSGQAMKGAGTIRVAVTAVDSRCRIAISDTGSGIPSDVLEKVFVPFFTTKSRGTGLGLPTAKRLIEAHDGQIDVECPSTGGTTVFVQLPIGAA